MAGRERVRAGKRGKQYIILVHREVWKENKVMQICKEEGQKYVQAREVVCL